MENVLFICCVFLNDINKLGLIQIHIPTYIIVFGV